RRKLIKTNKSIPRYSFSLLHVYSLDLGTFFLSKLSHYSHTFSLSKLSLVTLLPRAKSYSI
ncbi:MAG: hypothetical protein NO475_05310, partial [Candidatus Methanomethylicia archaeon]|nr:hypothetical protein [Candidatus Methanomethylicia archaeon]